MLGTPAQEHAPRGDGSGEHVPLVVGYTLALTGWSALLKWNVAHQNLAHNLLTTSMTSPQFESKCLAYQCCCSRIVWWLSKRLLSPVGHRWQMRFCACCWAILSCWQLTPRPPSDGGPCGCPGWWCPGARRVWTRTTRVRRWNPRS